MLSLPDSLRSAFKSPLGPVYTDADALLAEVERVDADVEPAFDAPLVAVGDIVTYHLRGAGRQPDVAVVDGKTERTAVDDEVRAALAANDGPEITVENPAATLSEQLLLALRDALSNADGVTITVDGEEDLAAVAAIVLAPVGSSVVYGQPGEGMVHVAVTESSTAEAVGLLERFDGDVKAALSILNS
jgi:uncharacterized protein (UPF0218 family)